MSFGLTRNIDCSFSYRADSCQGSEFEATDTARDKECADGDLLQQINKCKQERAYLREVGSCSIRQRDHDRGLLDRQTFGDTSMGCAKV